MAEGPKKITVEDLVNLSMAHMAQLPEGSPKLATFTRACPCGAPDCALEFLINVVPIDHVVHSITFPTRIH